MLRRIIFCLLNAVAMLFAYGCEAPLDLEGVTHEKTKSVLRFDQMQAAGSTSDTVVIVGSYGIVLISKDQGRNWHRKELNGRPPLIDIASCPDESFIALGYKGNIWLSLDQGENWNSVKIETTEVPQALTCDQKGTIWIVGSFSTIYSSDDLGKNWNQTSFDEDFIFTTVQFINDQQGVITGEFGNFMFTDDGGQSWQRGGSIPNEFYPAAAYFHDLDRGWVVGLSGVIFHTRDRGNSWQKEVTGINAPLYGITAQNNRLVAVGERGVVLYRDKFGKWNRHEYQGSIQSYIRAVLPVNSKDLLIAGGAGALRLIRLPDATSTFTENHVKAVVLE